MERKKFGDKRNETFPVSYFYLQHKIILNTIRKVTKIYYFDINPINGTEELAGML